MAKRKKDECIIIPQILLPHLPANPVVGKPKWLSPAPKIYGMRQGGALLLDDVIWRDRNGFIRTTPRGLFFDGMSYPWLTRKLFGWDKYDPETLRTAAMHDCGYGLHDYLCYWPISRKQIDVDLLDGLRLESPKWAWLKYRAVRRWGWITWGIKTDERLTREWLQKLWEGEKARDEWLKKVIEKDMAA